jgi:hypothetical protein
MNALRSLLYKLASLLGDINAIRRGPKAVMKRVVRKATTRSTLKALDKLFR